MQKPAPAQGVQAAFLAGEAMVWFSCLHPGSSDPLMGPRAATEVVLSWGGMWRPGLIEQN